MYNLVLVFDNDKWHIYKGFSTNIYASIQHKHGNRYELLQSLRECSQLASITEGGGGGGQEKVYVIFCHFCLPFLYQMFKAKMPVMHPIGI